MSLPVSFKRSSQIPLHGWILLITTILSCIGILTLLRASYWYSYQTISDPLYILNRQFVWFFTGACSLIVMAILDYRRLARLVYPALAVTLILILVLLVLQDPILYGASRNLLTGVIYPTELAKLVMLIYSALWLANRWNTIPKMDINFIMGYFSSLGIAAGLIMLLPDLSTALQIILVGGLLLLIAGWNWKMIAVVVGFSAAVAFLVTLVSATAAARFQDYVSFFINPAQGPFHLQFSIQTIQAGGLFGARDFQSGFSVPFPHTDSIFSVLVNQFGLLAGFGVLLLFLVLALLGLAVAARAVDPFGSLLASGISAMLLLDVFFHAASLSGLIPFMGHVMPLFSASGSNLVITLVGIGILISISRIQVLDSRPASARKEISSNKLVRSLQRLLP